MERRDFYTYLEIYKDLDSATIDLDEAEFELLVFRETHPNYLEILLGNYRNSFSEDLKSFITTNLIHIFSTESGLFRVVHKMLLDDLRRDYLDFVDLLDRLSQGKQVIETVFIPLLYYLSSCCSKKTVFEEFNSFLSCLEVVCSLEGVKKLLEKRSMWGLEPLEGRVDGAYSAFVYKNGGVCFLDGFFEPFVYKKKKRESPADNFYKTTPEELYEL